MVESTKAPEPKYIFTGIIRENDVLSQTANKSRLGFSGLRAFGSCFNFSNGG